MNEGILGFISSKVIYRVASFSWAKNYNTSHAPSSFVALVLFHRLESHGSICIFIISFWRILLVSELSGINAVAALRIRNGLPSIKEWGTRQILIILSSFYRHLFIIYLFSEVKLVFYWIFTDLSFIYFNEFCNFLETIVNLCLLELVLFLKIIYKKVILKFLLLLILFLILF